MTENNGTAVRETFFKRQLYAAQAFQV